MVNKTLLFTLIIILGSLLFFTTETAMAQSGNVYVTIRNELSESVCELNISPIYSTFWGEDLLNSSLRPYTSVAFWIPEGNYDLRAVTCESDNSIIRNNVAIYGSEKGFTLKPTDHSGSLGSGQPCPEIGVWPPGCVPNGNPTGGSQPCPEIGVWPPGCVPSGNPIGGGGQLCPETGVWPAGCIPRDSRGSIEPPNTIQRPNTGVLTSNQLTGIGTLLIKNNGDLDAVVILTPKNQSHITVATVYIRAWNQFTLYGIKDGNYDVYFTKGRDWNGTEFSNGATFGRFEESFYFPPPRGYYGWGITLDPVQNGNAPQETVPKQDFPSIR